MALDEIKETPEGVSLTLKLRLQNGLHARPAARLAREMQHYSSSVQICAETGTADAKSMLDVLSLALQKDSTFTVEAAGPDAREAVLAVRAFLENPGE